MTREETKLPSSDASMFVTIDAHGKALVKHDEELENHELRIQLNTKELEAQARDIQQLRDNALRLENVVMNENRDTRNTITQTNRELHELITNLMGYKTSTSTLASNITTVRIESVVKIIGILAGSGGILYYIFGAN